MPSRGTGWFASVLIGLGGAPVAIGWKMLLAVIPVTWAGAVGPRLLRVDVSTSDRLPEVCSDRLWKGCALGFPDVSKEVCATYNRN